MKKSITLFCAFLLAASFSMTASANQAQRIANKINGLIRAVNPNVQEGIAIKSLTTGNMLYSRNADHLMMPASSLKILTGESSLLFLGPDYQFHTEILGGDVSSAGSVDNLYFVFSGDPSLQVQDLRNMISQLKKKGVRRVNGNVIIDTSAYSDNGIGPGWMWDEVKYCYAAPINAAILNENCLTMSLRPADRDGQLATLELNPDDQFLKEQGSVVTGRASASCKLSYHIGEQNQVELSGCMSRSLGTQVLEASVSNVPKFVDSVVRGLLEQAGITVTGRVEQGHLAGRVAVLVDHSSAPLSALDKHMLKVSDDVYASALYKKIGELYYKTAGTWANGARAIQAILGKHAGFDADNMAMVDGSGVSRYNLVSAHQLLNILDYAYHQKKTFKYFYNALPIAGRDGTLKYRMTGRRMAGRVHAKTGSMTGVSSLSGYVRTANDHELAFSIIFNGYVGPINKYRTLQDRIVTYLETLT